MQERRHYPRYSCDAQLRICGSADHQYVVEANDISEAGISLTIAQSVVTNLSSQGVSLDIGSKFDLLLPVVGNDAGESTTICCQVMHARRLSQDYFFIGAWFTEPLETMGVGVNNLIINARNAEED